MPKASGRRPKAQGLVKEKDARAQASGLWFFIIHADSRRRARGAYINCWINFRLRDGALTLARFYIEQAGWRFRSLTEQKWIQGLSGVPTDSRLYYREAKHDGASFVFHQYPKTEKRKARLRKSARS